MKAVFEFIPEFSIEGYQSVTVEKPSVEITEEEFQREIEQLRESRATIEPVEEDRALVDGDWAQITYNGLIAGEVDAPPVAGEDTLVEIGGKDTVAAFSAVLRGAKVDQELKAEVIYPADYAEPKLAGKTVAYEVTVKAIKKRIVPELTDEFAQELGHYENLADLEARVRDHISSRKQRSVEGETKDQLFAKLGEKYSFAVPEVLVQQQIDVRLDRGLRALAAQGMSADQMRKLDFTRLRAAQHDGAVAEVKTNLLLDRIAAEENISVSDEELDRELQLAALQSREPVESLRARLTQDGGLARIREQIKREKTAQRFMSGFRRRIAEGCSAPAGVGRRGWQATGSTGSQRENGKTLWHWFPWWLSRRAGASAPTTFTPACCATTLSFWARPSTTRWPT